MTIESRRRFTMADVMILVAATAGGFALLRLTGTNFSSLDPTRYRLRIVQLIFMANSAFCAFLLTWTPAVLLLSLRSPRPDLRQLFRQTGAVACGSATLAIAIKLLPLLLVASTIGIERAVSKGLLSQASRMVENYARDVPFAVEGAWLTLALGGLWHRERTWIDRLGMILGIAWITSQLVECFCIFITTLVPM